MSEPILGIIADDFTGATDIGSMLVSGGLSVVQTIGTPDADFEFGDADAIVVALKTRSIPVSDAVSQSLAALTALQRAGVSQFQFKYCSTFDSTPVGNIGPVSDALAAQLGCDQVVHIPSLPVNGRTVFKGHLFVGDKLLNECGMENHPLNPMTDANLQRWLTKQVKGDVRVIEHSTIGQGAEYVRTALSQLCDVSHVIGDAIDEADLDVWADVLHHSTFFAGGSGLAKPLARRIAASRDLTLLPRPDFEVGGTGQTLILAGSCSKATLTQIEAFRKAGGVTLLIDPIALETKKISVETVAQRAKEVLANGPVLIHSSAGPEDVEQGQERLGADRAGALIEDALSQLAAILVNEQQVTRMVVAGGETSGAVVSRLGAAALKIGAEIDPGVPWTLALDASGASLIPLALKSGNFGAEDFFLRTSNLGGT